MQSNRMDAAVAQEAEEKWKRDNRPSLGTGRPRGRLGATYRKPRGAKDQAIFAREINGQETISAPSLWNQEGLTQLASVCQLATLSQPIQRFSFTEPK